MSQERDPFEKLARFEDPEPDSAVMRATIVRSRDAFVKQKSGSVQPKPVSWVDWLKQSANWLIPAGACIVAMTIAIVVVPSFNAGPPTSMDQETAARRLPPAAPSQSPAQSPTQAPSNELARSRDSTADRSGTGAGVRMGMRPGQAPAEPPPVQTSIFQGNDIRIGSRLTSSALELYLPDISGERVIDSQGLIPGDEVEILDAFRITERDIVAIRLRDGSTRFWRIYSPKDGNYTRDPELSKLASDAADKAEVERRLSPK